MVVLCLAQNLTFWKIRKKIWLHFLAHLRKVWRISEKKIWQHWTQLPIQENVEGKASVSFQENSKL
jgi:hypothetical protein